MAKIFSGVVLAGIGIILSIGTSKISKSLDTGRLVQSLITELSNPDSSSLLKQDIALLTLDHTLYDDNPELVMDICKKVVLSKHYDIITSNTALEIIQKHDKRLYESLRNDEETKSKIADNLNLFRDSAASKTLDQAEIKFFEHIRKNVIYIQFTHAENRKTAEQLRTKLSATYFAPGVECVTGNKKNAIIYYFPEDAALANAIYTEVTQFLKTAELKQAPGTLEILDYSGRGYKAVKGQIEIWLEI
jgi:hypothetical protein